MLVVRYTPLRLGAWKGTFAVVKALLDGGADPNIKDIYGCSILCELVPTR